MADALPRLATPPHPADRHREPDTAAPYRRLTALTDGRGGYLAPVLSVLP